MKFTFGEHKGKSVDFVILKEPDYVQWILSMSNANGPLIQVRNEVLRLISIFDSKPFIIKCFGCKRRPATRLSLAHPTSSPYWWCDVCSHLSMGCDSHLTIVRTYENALLYSKLFPQSFDLKSFILDLAKAKGLPPRVGEPQATNFFDAI